MEYNVPSGFPQSEVNPSMILVKGEALVGKRSVAYSIIESVRTDDTSLFVLSSRMLADKAREELQDETGYTGDSLSILDATGNQTDEEYEVSSAGDLTGIGVEFSRWNSENGVPPFVFLFDSLSTTLMYQDAENCFEFLHVLRSHILQQDGLGIVFYDDAGANGDFSKLAQLFDYIIEVGSDDEGKTISLQGFATGNGTYSEEEFLADNQENGSSGSETAANSDDSNKKQTKQ